MRIANPIYRSRGFPLLDGHNSHGDTIQKERIYAYVSKHRFISPEICEKDLFPRQSRCNHGRTKICVFKNEINSEGACRKRIMSIKAS